METAIHRTWLQTQSLVHWNSLIKTATQNGSYEQSLKHYTSMLKHGVNGDSHTYPYAAKACAKLGCLQFGKRLHALSLVGGFRDDVYVQTSLLDMYGKCSDLSSARYVFDEMPVRSLVSWNSMISGYCREFRVEEAMGLLKEMWAGGACPNSSTFVSIVSGIRWWFHGFSVHGCAVKFGFDSDVLLSNALMSMYVRFNLVDSARALFDEMKEGSNVSWTVIIGGYAKLDDFAEMFKLFSGMRHSNVNLDYLSFVNLFQVDDILVGSSLHALVVKYGFDMISVIANSLVNMYARCRDLSSARKLFDLVKADDVVLYTSMIAAYMHNGCPDEALSLYENMLAVNVKPNEITVATALLACADAGSLSMGQKVADYIKVNGFDSDLQIQTSLIHMYCKCGSINSARDVFDRIPTKDIAVWSPMIFGYATIGDANEALQLFEIMINQGLKPDAIIFIGLLLACSHAGMVEDGVKIFSRMQNEFGIKPGSEHFSCLVDLLGRSGHLELALEALYQMPDNSYSKVLGPLLSACKTYGNIKVGEAVANRLSSLEPNYARSYILMSSIYASVGRWKDAATMRRMVDSRGLVKEAGRSSIEINGPG